MANPDRSFAQPMAWWGAVAGSVRAKATTAEVWTAIREFGAANGLAYPPGMFQEVNRMRSQATGLRIATQRLGLALNSDAITGRDVAALPYARPGTSQDLLRQYHVRVNYEAVRAGQLEQSYITLPYTGELPATVGQLRDDAQIATDALVSGYGAELLSIGAIEIGEW